jgi:signal transduction histidine kinase
MTKRPMFKLTTPPRVFAAISLLMIVAMVISTGMIQAQFFRQSIIDREATLVGDMVHALAVDHTLLDEDLNGRSRVDSKARLDLVFNTISKLPGTTRIKVFDRHGVIVWSDAQDLVGTKHTEHPDLLAKASGGEVQAVFNLPRSGPNAEEIKSEPFGTIECYVPIFSTKASVPASAAMGVLSLYRDPQDLNQTIQRGLHLLWVIIGGGGAILFIALYRVFSLVHRRQETAESSLSKLTLEHERIVQIEKMSAMGELVGEIAHQLNNPLVGVINLTELAQRNVRDPQRVAELLADVGKAGAECRDIVQRILRINQASRSTLQETNVNELVHDTITFCQQSVDLHHAVSFSAPDPAIVLTIDPVLIRQALFNLIHNAILAAPRAKVHVVLARVDRNRVPGVQISVTDTGPGFGADTAAKLFKPFFTTRSNGTGLGLSVAQHIAMKHGGAIVAENISEGGARFSIWLPQTVMP